MNTAGQGSASIPQDTSAQDETKMTPVRQRVLWISLAMLPVIITAVVVAKILVPHQARQGSSFYVSLFLIVLPIVLVTLLVFRQADRARTLGENPTKSKLMLAVFITGILSIVLSIATFRVGHIWRSGFQVFAALVACFSAVSYWYRTRAGKNFWRS